MSQLVTNIQRFSLHDGGGIRTVVFLKGCPHACPWCANPENLSFTPEVSWNRAACIGCSLGADGLCHNEPAACPVLAKRTVGEPMTARETADAFLRDKVFYEESGGGATFSGGECLAGRERQAFVCEVASLLKPEGVSLAVETALAVPLFDVDALCEAVDVWLVDFKIADADKSKSVCNLDVALRDANLEAILSRGAEVVARLPLIPGFTATEANVSAVADTLERLGITRADVLPFHQLGSSKYANIGRDYSMGGVAQMDPADAQWAVELLASRGIDARTGGE